MDKTPATEELRYPIGRFDPREGLTDDERQAVIEVIEETPEQLRDAVEGLGREQLDTPYREGGWTVRQVVHHVADSHLNGYLRFKWALTEDEPAIKTYEESRWAELPEARRAAPEVSLSLLDALHRRWMLCLESMEPDDFARTLRYPDGSLHDLERYIQLYAWHGLHHTGHVTSLREREGW